MNSILMVCLGNICRSPLAQGLLQSKLPQQSFFVDSAGTSNYHTGKKPDKRSIAIAKYNGIDISKQYARTFEISDFDTFDIIYVMDRTNFENIATLARDTYDLDKLKLILEMDTKIQDKNVPDPYYEELLGFEIVFQLLDNVTSIIAKQLLQ